MVFPWHPEAATIEGKLGGDVYHLSFEGENQIDVFPRENDGAYHRHQRNLIVGGIREENTFIFYLI